MLCIGTPLSTLAATFYVDDGSIGNDAYTITQAQNPSTPWRTIQKCANTATSGDTCSVNDGTYTGTVSISTSGITFKSTNYRGAKLSGNNQASLVGFGLKSTASNTTIDGFEIYGFSQIAVNINGGSTNVIIRNNWIHDIGRICTSTTQGLVGVFAGATNNLLIERNTLNTIGRFANGESGCTITTDMRHDHGIYTSGNSGLTVRNNVFYDVTRGFPIHLYPNALTNVKILNNTFADSKFAQGQILFATNITTMDIANNIFYNPAVGALNATTYASFSGVTVRNNLISDTSSMWEEGGRPISPPSGTTGSCGNNGNLCNVDPLFTNVGARIYTLQSRSPAIGPGLNFSASFTNDYIGNIRSVPWDVGAYEFSQGLVAPAAPTNLTVK
jgi:hypothetical protein